MNNFKFIFQLKLDDVRKLCISHNWFDKATEQEYQEFFTAVSNANYLSINEERLLIIARIIKQFSFTDESIKEIRQSLETILRVNEREV